MHLQKNAGLITRLCVFSWTGDILRLPFVYEFYNENVQFCKNFKDNKRIRAWFHREPFP